MIIKLQSEKQHAKSQNCVLLSKLIRNVSDTYVIEKLLRIIGANPHKEELGRNILPIIIQSINNGPKLSTAKHSIL